MLQRAAYEIPGYNGANRQRYYSWSQSRVQVHKVNRGLDKNNFLKLAKIYSHINHRSSLIAAVQDFCRASSSKSVFLSATEIWWNRQVANKSQSYVTKHVVLNTSFHSDGLPILKLDTCFPAISRSALHLVSNLCIDFCYRFLVLADGLTLFSLF